MSAINSGASLAKVILGTVVSKAYTPLVVETKALFTVSGLVYMTAIVGQVTTAISVANTVKLQANPTVGTISDLTAATDLGTVATPAGNLLTITGTAANSIISGIGATGEAMTGLFVSAGTIEQVTATGANGGITWYVSYVPIAAGATIVAA